MMIEEVRGYVGYSLALISAAHQITADLYSALADKVLS